MEKIQRRDSNGSFRGPAGLKTAAAIKTRIKIFGSYARYRDFAFSINRRRRFLFGPKQVASDTGMRKCCVG
jgi:hypothetical protein